MTPSHAGGVDLHALLALFPEEALLDGFQQVPPEAVPEPYRTLLVHPHHMTVTLERFHGERVRLRVLRHTQQRDKYARMILLELQGTGQVVQFGIMRFDLRFSDDAVRARILEGDTPLGRILIEHNVMTEIQPAAYLRISPGRAMRAYFELTAAQPTYGRIAIIRCDGDAAVELLEVAVATERPRS